MFPENQSATSSKLTKNRFLSNSLKIFRSCDFAFSRSLDIIPSCLHALNCNMGFADKTKFHHVTKSFITQGSPTIPPALPNFHMHTKQQSFDPDSSKLQCTGCNVRLVILQHVILSMVPITILIKIKYDLQNLH